ncbi:GNAT family N-acetyltransferase [Cellulosilyticum sp. I15G10I2]|uniref:GNAT family N-acetyltransferase n=1 Tax=Cellulosilyticum sp. I15G10I2 TaxID=1892843 RepID=UPI001495D832|nr:GNAT family N-acetyltransferase [Cellulosilyticum sp. I15G10I2]
MIKVFDKAIGLPDAWDTLFKDSCYMSKQYLEILERCNPCGQKYVMINDSSAFIVYELKLNIFCYSRMNFNLKVNIIGIPCSVSGQGYRIEEADIKELENYIIKAKKSCIILNSDDSFLSKSLIQGETLPTCKLQIMWDSFEDYKLSLRSHYRYRLNNALKKGEKIIIKKLEDNRLFDEPMYALYEQVYSKSNYKLEKLSIDFFRRMPTDIYVFYIENQPAAFVQLSDYKDELLFVFGGMDYALNHEYDLYINMLIFILRHGIENRYLAIDMGQTAEDAKMKLGCKQYKKYMYLYHPNFIIRFLIKLFVKKLSYKPLELKINLFKSK